jgi:hypothetical protein
MTCIAAAKHLVRDLLGCSCPDEVFADIDLRWRGATRALDLRVGGRLLVHLRWPVDIPTAEIGLVSWLHEGRVTRDRDGLNRYRLVLALEPDTPSLVRLRQRFAQLRGDDERLHLHLLSPLALTGLVEG